MMKRCTDVFKRQSNMFAFAPLFSLNTTLGQNHKFMILGLVLCVLVGGMWGFFALRTKRQREEASRSRSNVIRERLQQVLDADGRLEMFPAQRTGNANGQMLVGRCLACTHDSLELEFGLTDEVPVWRHSVVDMYFRITVDGAQVFYVFTATVRASAVHGSRLRIEMPLPVHLRKEQKRALFRVNLPSNMVPALALWASDAERDAEAELHPRALGMPLLTGRAGKSRHLALNDLSAGGVCLELDKEQVIELGIQSKPGKQYILLSVLADRDDSSDTRQFWFKCLCRHTHNKAKNGNPLIGLQFRAWCITRQVTEPIVWVPMASNGEVPILLDWLVNWSRSGQRCSGAASAKAVTGQDAKSAPESAYGAARGAGHEPKHELKYE